MLLNVPRPQDVSPSQSEARAEYLSYARQASSKNLSSSELNEIQLLVYDLDKDGVVTDEEREIVQSSIREARLKALLQEQEQELGILSVSPSNSTARSPASATPRSEYGTPRTHRSSPYTPRSPSMHTPRSARSGPWSGPQLGGTAGAEDSDGEGSMLRTKTRGGSDVSVESQKYLWLKKHLGSRGAPPQDLHRLLGVAELREYALQYGYMSVKEEQQIDRDFNVQGHGTPRRSSSRTPRDTPRKSPSQNGSGGNRPKRRPVSTAKAVFSPVKGFSPIQGELSPTKGAKGRRPSFNELSAVVLGSSQEGVSPPIKVQFKQPSPGSVPVHSQDSALKRVSDSR